MLNISVLGLKYFCPSTIRTHRRILGLIVRQVYKWRCAREKRRGLYPFKYRNRNLVSYSKRAGLYPRAIPDVGSPRYNWNAAKS